MDIVWGGGSDKKAHQAFCHLSLQLMPYVTDKKEICHFCSYAIHLHHVSNDDVLLSVYVNHLNKWEMVILFYFQSM